jgi:hypothetical protein
MIGDEKGFVIVGEGNRAVRLGHSFAHSECNRGERLAGGIGEEHVIDISYKIRNIEEIPAYMYTTYGTQVFHGLQANFSKKMHDSQFCATKNTKQACH